jgi:dTDP-glucose 4,6-dehydratase
MRLLITGGCGFIGSAVIRHLIRDTDHSIVNIDAMTYAASEDALEAARQSNRHELIRTDIADAAAMADIFATRQPDAVMHLAAESHVDRSIDGPADFMRTNIMGTFTLLEAARAYYNGLTGDKRTGFRFHHVSTDEVFGALEADDPPFRETSGARLAPHLRLPGLRLQHHQQLRLLAVPRKAHPARPAQCAGGQAPAGLW